MTINVIPPKLGEIINLNSYDNLSVEISHILKYKKSLFVYYSEMFGCEPVLMITSIFNSCSYAKIVPCDFFNEALDNYINSCELSEEDAQHERDLICFNSIYLSQL